MASTVQRWPAGQAPSNTAGSIAKEVYVGAAVSRSEMANIVEGDLGDEPTAFTLEINRYTTTQQAERYAQILKKNGQGGLLQAIRMENLGYFQLSGQPERPVIFAQQSVNPTGRTITVLCERWLNTFIEGFEDRAADLRFAYIEMSIDNRGKGEGSMFTAASVKFIRQPGNIVGLACYAARVDFANTAGSSIGVEDYANARDWLQNVRFKETGPVQAQR
jgi:hypothetical protein